MRCVLKHVSINGYDLHLQYTSSAAGFIALYITSNLEYIIRDYDFETIWVELKNKKSLNILLRRVKAWVRSQ